VPIMIGRGGRRGIALAKTLPPYLKEDSFFFWRGFLERNSTISHGMEKNSTIPKLGDTIAIIPLRIVLVAAGFDWPLRFDKWLYAIRFVALRWTNGFTPVCLRFSIWQHIARLAIDICMRFSL